jgi:hypothetical protein
MRTYFKQLCGIQKWSSFTEGHSGLPSLFCTREHGLALREHSPSFQVGLRYGLAVLLCGFTAGCITDTTTDVTKAPFDASTGLTDTATDVLTRVTDGTSQATTDLTEPTREFLSSTTPGAWFNTDGTLHAEHKKIAFIVLNFDNLQEDMAHGRGEYLESLSVLVGVPAHSREQFSKSAQGQYEYIFEEGQSRPEALRRLLQTLHRMSFPSS